MAANITDCQLIDDFSGGMRPPWVTKYGMNESAGLYNIWHDGMNLRTMEGRKLLNAKDILPNKPVLSHDRVYSPTQGQIVAKCGSTLWVGLNCITTAANISLLDAPTVEASTVGFAASGAFMHNGLEVVTYTHKDDTHFYGCGSHSVIDTGDTLYDMDFRPLAGSCQRDGSNAYISTRHENGEYIVQIDSRVYILNGGFDVPLRWDMFTYSVGRVKCTAAGGLTIVTPEAGTGIDFSTGVIQGDIIFFKDHTSSAPNGEWQFGAGARTIKKVEASQLTLDGNGFDTTGKGVKPTAGNPTVPTSSDYVDYIIVRVHRLGLPSGGTAVSSAATAGGNLTDGHTYQYIYRYGNSQTGKWGNPSGASAGRAANSTNKTVPVSGWPTRPTDRDIDTIEVYRSHDVGATYYRIATITAASTDYTFASSINDALAEPSTSAMVLLNPEAWYHERPAVASLGRPYVWNFRLYARQTGQSAHYLQYSTLNEFEYWPLNFDFGKSSPSSIDPGLGGRVKIGDHYGDPITGIVGEGGNYMSSGRQGTNLLVQTRSKTVRWYGIDATDFARDDAFKIGAVNSRVTFNYGGWILWVSPDGLMRMPAGSSTPEPVFRKFWPRGIGEFMLKSPKSSYLGNASAAIWGDWYVLAYTSGSDTINKNVLCYHIPTDTWCAAMSGPTDPHPVTDFSVWGGSIFQIGTTQVGDSGEISAGDAEYGRIWSLFARTGRDPNSDFGAYSYWAPKASWNPTGPTPVSASFISRPLDYATNPKGVFRSKSIKRLIATWIGAPSSQNVDCSLYADGDTLSKIWPAVGESTTAAIPIVASGSYKRVTTIWDPVEDEGVLHQIQLSGSFTRQVELVSLQIEPSDLGDGTEVQR